MAWFTIRRASTGGGGRRGGRGGDGKEGKRERELEGESV